MSKFTFICQEGPCPFGESITTKRTVEFDAVHLEGIINEFESFLRGCGYYIDGHLEIVNEKEYESLFNDGDFNRDGELDMEARQSYDNLDLYTESLFGKK